MALVQVRRSDKSGDELPAQAGARVRIEFYDGKRTARRADLTDAEADALIEEYGLKEVETRPERRGTNVPRLRTR